MKISIGGDSRHYMFGAIGIHKAVEKLGMNAEYLCCGLSCLSLSLSMIYSPNRAFHILEKKSDLLRRIFGRIYDEGLKPPNAVEITLALASSKFRIHLPFLRNRFEELLKEMVPSVQVDELESLSILAVDLEDAKIVKMSGVDLRYAIGATCRFTPTSDPFDHRYVSCSRSIGIPEGDVVLKMNVHSAHFKPKRALEFISLSVNSRREYIEKLTLERAKVPIVVDFKSKVTDFKIMDSVYKKALKVLGEGVEQYPGEELG